MDYLLITYLAYIVVTLVLTFWVGRILFTNGKVFLKDIFNDEIILNSVNKLFKVGFYSLNLGYILCNLFGRTHIKNHLDIAEVLSSKIGLHLIILGTLHVLNLFLLIILRSRSKRSHTALSHTN